MNEPEAMFVDLVEKAQVAPAGTEILAQCLKLAEMLIEKNTAYGDSVLNPVRVFSTASQEEQILVRLDDKVSRLVRGDEAGEDVLLDMAGYWCMLQICRERNAFIEDCHAGAVAPYDHRATSIVTSPPAEITARFEDETLDEYGF